MIENVKLYRYVRTSSLQNAILALTINHSPLFSNRIEQKDEPYVAYFHIGARTLHTWKYYRWLRSWFFVVPGAMYAGIIDDEDDQYTYE